MKFYIYRLIFFFISCFIICSILYFIFSLITGTNLLAEFYWIYNWYYPFQYILILSGVFSIMITCLSNVLVKITSIPFRYIVLIFIFIIITLLTFLFEIVLYNIHDKGSIFSIDNLLMIINNISGYFFIYIINGIEIVRKLLPAEITAIICGLIISEIGIFMIGNQH
jgi:hypothetical protein